MDEEAERKKIANEQLYMCENQGERESTTTQKSIFLLELKKRQVILFLQHHDSKRPHQP